MIVVKPGKPVIIYHGGDEYFTLSDFEIRMLNDPSWPLPSFAERSEESKRAVAYMAMPEYNLMSCTELCPKRTTRSVGYEASYIRKVLS